jgi:hypothetical protein
MISSYLAAVDVPPGESPAATETSGRRRRIEDLPDDVASPFTAAPPRGLTRRPTGVAGDDARVDATAMARDAIFSNRQRGSRSVPGGVVCPSDFHLAVSVEAREIAGLGSSERPKSAAKVVWDHRIEQNSVVTRDR